MVKIGSTIFLELEETKNNVKVTRSFRCRFVDIESNRLIIDYPIDEETNKPSYFFDGTEFRAWYIAEDDAVYSFNTEIVGRRKGHIPVLLLKDPGKENYIRIQRRNHVRVETAVDVALHPINQEFSPFTSATIDISGGGCALIIPQGNSLPQNGELTIWLILHLQSGEISYVKARCRIIRIVKPREDARERVSLQFIEMDKQDREKIIRFCFERQLAIRRKQEA
ncbi:flagellar brake protein [Halalkalibacter krulwichiae]|uniref:Flagellar brake protein YcgR n=1 Tax=Halalkalibacter krulwichiae TaxID=199441 RepID=A0A1X9MA55_9BACI|nr:flagellar brake domain-containing protein [Halalkalibacter krulwichiae]ARK30286.1 Flagellar brake protein YcgR [Halalkalibacter krulwichiae]